MLKIKFKIVGVFHTHRRFTHTPPRLGKEGCSISQPMGTRGFWPPPGTLGLARRRWAHAGDKRLMPGGQCVPCGSKCMTEFRGTTAEPPRVPPGRGEPAWEAPQWFPRQRWDAGFLSHHRRWLKYPLRSAAG